MEWHCIPTSTHHSPYQRYSANCHTIRRPHLTLTLTRTSATQPVAIPAVDPIGVIPGPVLRVVRFVIQSVYLGGCVECVGTVHRDVSSARGCSDARGAAGFATICAKERAS